MKTCVWLKGSTNLRDEQTKPDFCKKQKCNGYNESCQMYYIHENWVEKLFNKIHYKICEWSFLKLSGFDKKGHF